MSRQDPSAATGKVAGRDLGRCTCTHIEGVHNVTTTLGRRNGCSAWVGGYCSCRRYTPQETP